MDDLHLYYPESDDSSIVYGDYTGNWEVSGPGFGGDSTFNISHISYWEVLFKKTEICICSRRQNYEIKIQSTLIKVLMCFR